MGTESRNRNNQWEILDEGYRVDIQVMFYSMMLLCNIVEPFCTVKL